MKWSVGLAEMAGKWSSVKKCFEIILAEDNPADVFLVREARKEHGLDCVLRVVKDGAEAIALLNRFDSDCNDPQIDLLLIDMHLPKRSGEEILKCLRSTERYAQLPVVVISSADSDRIKQQAAKHAALSYFRKPSNLDEFMELGLIIRQILAGKHEGHVVSIGRGENTRSSL